MTRPELLFAARSRVGEGPHWDPVRSTLHWVDIEQDQVHELDWTTGADRVIQLDQRVGVALPVAGSPGRRIVGLRDGVAIIDERGFSIAQTPIEAGLPTQRLNDGACDIDGRLWVGSMDEAGGRGGCALYRVDSDLTATPVLTGLSLSNGLGWSPDGQTLYHAETSTRTVTAWDALADGTLGKGRPLVDLRGEAGSPDGVAVDVDGCVWVAMWEGGNVLRVSPSGTVLDRVQLPVSRVTSCCFAVPGLDTLVITTACTGMTRTALEAEPLAGSLFTRNSPTPGVPCHAFRWDRAGTEP